MRKLCIDNGLPIKYGFDIKYKYFEYCSIFNKWNVWRTFNYKKNKVTEQEFIELLKNTKL